jgi:hypothetical protein
MCSCPGQGQCLVAGGERLIRIPEKPQGPGIAAEIHDTGVHDLVDDPSLGRLGIAERRTVLEM